MVDDAVAVCEAVCEAEPDAENEAVEDELTVRVDEPVAEADSLGLPLLVPVGERVLLPVDVAVEERELELEADCVLVIVADDVPVDDELSVELGVDVAEVVLLALALLD